VVRTVHVNVVNTGRYIAVNRVEASDTVATNRCGGANLMPITLRPHQFDSAVADAVRTYLLASFGNGAGLMVAENVHWFDPSTMDVLGALLGTARQRLLVVMTARRIRGFPRTGRSRYSTFVH
jgi:hypothetical protein